MPPAKLVVATIVKEEIKGGDRGEEADEGFELVSGHGVTNQSYCLEVFYDATKHVSGTKYPTANFYFKSVCDVQNNLLRWKQSDDGCLRSMACTMRLKFDKYWRDTNLFMALGVVLDPRYKMQLVECVLQMIYEDDCEYYVKKIKNDVVDLFSEYASKYNNFGGVVGDASESIGARGKDSDEHSMNDKSIFGNKRFFKFIQERTGGVRSHRKTELDMYLEEGLFPATDDEYQFDILN
ncbi:hypothetical protein NE237_022936 [Protea cynaroides]|uniref:hAT-like transposase RNase-H fold domain-containing protein n=1 Tax=Protea cynaroides TaxID=273540 RepID=A0A9Q0HFD4_9MAGN|nr:hypothetical protein NE237_022936 [Protea cynaroides]